MEEAKRVIKESKAFIDLEFSLGRFRTAISGNVFDAGDRIDGHLASAYAIPHAFVPFRCVPRKS